MADVRETQVPVALSGAPQLAVVVAGMNDTLRSDFDPAGLHGDLAALVADLVGAGTHVLLLRYHDHSRVFRMPAALARALRRRIVALNAVTVAVAEAHPGRVGVLDLDTLDGGYDRASWAVDRLHPSERGHRMLARGFADLVADAGFTVPTPVDLTCAGGRTVSPLHRTAWLVGKGVPWLVRRSRDLGPVIVQGFLGELRDRSRSPALDPPGPGQPRNVGSGLPSPPGHQPDRTNRSIRRSASSNSGSAVA